MACLQWETRNFEQAPLRVYRKQRDGKRKPIEEHPLHELLEHPNPYYSGYNLMAATLISHDTHGDAYWLKRRGANGFGFPEELWYVPHWMMEPYTEPGSPNFIDYYLYTINGQRFRVEIEDVVHFRNGLNPDDLRRGFAPVRAVLREIFGDEEAGIFAASLLKNMGIPGVVIAPDEGTIIEPKQAEAIKELYQKRMAGSERGKPLILDFPAKVSTLGLSPVDLATVEQRLFNEARICSVLGISPAVVNLPSGSKNAQSYNNLVNLRKAAFEENLVPRWRSFGKQIKRQLLRDFPNSEALTCEYDTSEVQALKEAESERQKREREKFLGAGQTWNEYRTALGMPTDPNGEWLMLPSNGQPITMARLLERANAEMQQPEPDPTDPTKGIKKKAERSPHEAGQAQAVAKAQDGARVLMADTLRPIRARLITDGLTQLPHLEMQPLALELTPAELASVRNIVQLAYQAGADTVQSANGKALVEKSLLDTLGRVLKVAVSAFIARISGRLIDEFSRAILRGVPVTEAVAAVQAELEAEPAAYVEEIASGLAYESVGSGRFDALRDAALPGDRFIYSAILDKNTCEPCEADDLKEADDPAKLPHAPNPQCRGRWRCRCMIVIARD
ncbi:portal protein [Bacteriophage sp.]|nr:portal protein [Bacteriophage sp.]